MSLTLRPATSADAEAMACLVEASFLEFAATDWTEVAVARFLAACAPAALGPAIASSFLACAAHLDDEAVGFALMPRPSLLGMLFVSPRHVGKGVARCLWEHARTEVELRAPQVRTVELNATPFALPAYRALGFYPISPAFSFEGSVATRMACWLPARALAQQARAPD